ncbi:MAG: lysylphosphatidylglycerol synthase domain-containing protein [Flavobacteriales bacterium]
MDKSKKIKYVSRAIKFLIVLLPIAFIYNQIVAEWHEKGISSLNPIQYLEQNWPLFFIVLGLVFFNWGFEALKWKFLVSKVQKVNFWQSYKGVLSGVTISIFAPLRTGEYIGRVLHLEPENRISGSVLSVYGSMIQLFITIFCGAVAWVFFFDELLLSDVLYRGLITASFFVVLSSMFLSLIKPSWVVFLVRKTRLPEKWKNYFNVLADFNLPQLLIQGILVSFLRYSVFSLQFYFAVDLFGVHLPFWNGIAIVSFTFLGLSFLSLSALMELGFTRATIFLTLFTLCSKESYHQENMGTAIWLASTLIWLVNLALPALTGAILMYGVKIFKEKE